MRRLRTILAACALCCLAGPSVASAWRNPVIAGDVPDPSVVRAGGTYWLTGTSGDHAPVFPLFRARDLFGWRQVGSIFLKAPPGTRGGYWAPALAHGPAGWRVYYSARRRRGPPCVFVATAPSPLSAWSGRGMAVCPRRGAIDPAPVTDAAGREYLLWKGKGRGNGIYGAPLAPGGVRLAGAPRLLIAPRAAWEDGVTEGPDLVRHDGAYYLFYSGGECCRLPCDYGVGIARADAVLGPYRKERANPVLRGGNGWKCPGHGSVIADRAGRLRFVHHAYRSDDADQVHRQVLLEPVTWGADGWPRIGVRGRPVPRAPGPQRLSFADGFGGRFLAPGWEWVYDHPPVLRVGGGALRILHGSVSRAWTPYDYTVRARVRGGRGDLGIVLQGGALVDVSAVPGDDRLRIDVRGRRLIALYRCRRGRHCRRAGRPVLAPRVASRIRLGRGVYDGVTVRPLG